MLISSQDKNTIVNLDHLTAIEATEIYSEPNLAAGIYAHLECDVDYDDGIMLGRYANLERAREILNDIKRAYIKANNGPMVLQMPPYEEVDNV